MPSKGNTVDAFYALLRAGLWEQSVRLSPFSPIDFDALYKLAEEQSVVGLIAAGLEHVEDMTLAKPQVMPFMKQVFSLENRNMAMNDFIASLIEKLRAERIQALLVKGQGIAQCYERPMWRSAGDIDLLFEAKDYENAKGLLQPLASSCEEENVFRCHLSMMIDSWNVELHGTMRSRLSESIDRKIDEILIESFVNRSFRIWQNEGITINLPEQNDDIIYVFTHIIQHFFRGGIGLRQICDWCRLMWTFRDSIDRTLLEVRLQQMHLMTEWRAFAALAVRYLGIPIEALPLFDSSNHWHRKSKRINSFILKVGNFGHNLDRSYYNKYPYFIYKAISLYRHIGDFFRHVSIFPLDSLRVFFGTITYGIKVVSEGK